MPFRLQAFLASANALADVTCSASPSVGTCASPPAIVGFDLHPLAVASARANYLLAIADLLGPETPIDVPVFARDAILDQRPDEAAL